MAKASLHVDPRLQLGSIDEQIYGHFTEHIGRCIYGGIYQPGHPTADADGFRTDVLELVRELRPAHIRWPGGNFASGYHWRDGVGPKDARPLRKDLAWGVPDDNTFGTDEFLKYCEVVGTQPYLNLNMGTGTIDEAIQWLDYCNGTEPTPEVQLRNARPHDVRIWGLGNEVYGFWQHGHTDAATYAVQAREWAKLLKWQDRSIKVIGVGAPSADWNWTLLKTAGKVLDYMSLHYYWRENPADPYRSLLAGPLHAEQHLIGQWGLSQAAAVEQKLAKPVRLGIDEWNVWTHTSISIEATLDPWHDNTGFEEAYTLRDALAVATFMNVLWRHPEKVGLATLAQMVNVLAPITTTEGGCYAHSIYYPLVEGRKAAGPIALDARVNGDGWVGTPGMGATMLDAAATFHPSAKRLHLSLVNRSESDELVVALDLPRLNGDAQITTLHHDDVNAGNDPSNPDRVRPVTVSKALAGELVLPPHSHTTVVASL